MSGPLLQLARVTFRRQLLSRKTALALSFLGLLAVVMVVLGALRAWSAKNFGRWVALDLYGGFFVPVVALAFGTGALGDERDEKSLVHLLVRALPRWGIYLAKFAAVAPLVLALSVGGLALLAALARLHAPAGGAFFGPFWPGVLWSTLAYLALFHLFAAVFRHSTVIALAYVFFVEVFIGNMPGILKRISVQFYAKSMSFERAASEGLAPRGREFKLYLPIDGDVALWVLVGLTAALLALGALLFARREYRDLG